MSPEQYLSFGEVEVDTTDLNEPPPLPEVTLRDTIPCPPPTMDSEVEVNLHDDWYERTDEEEAIGF